MDNEFKVVQLPAIVQGKTMAQWERESALNEERERRGECHVHPTFSDPPTDEEWEAFVHSMTTFEKLRNASRMGGPFSGLFSLAALVEALGEVLGDDDDDEED